jgi:hypothetical protein
MRICDNSTNSGLGWTDLAAQKLVDDAYQKDPSEWIKRSIHTSAKVRENSLSLGLCLGDFTTLNCRWASSAPTALL